MTVDVLLALTEMVKPDPEAPPVWETEPGS